MVAHIETNQEICKDAAHIEGDESKYGVMSKLRGEETLGLLASRVKRANLGSGRPQQNPVESIVGDEVPPFLTVLSKKRLRVTIAHPAGRLTEAQPFRFTIVLPT